MDGTPDLQEEDLQRVAVALGFLVSELTSSVTALIHAVPP